MVNSPGNGGVEIETSQVPMQTLELCQEAAELVKAEGVQTFTPAGLGRADNTELTTKATCLKATE